MKLKCLGAGKTVTGSKFLVSINQQNILIDCGLYQGEDDLAMNKLADSLIRSEQIDAVILTHAHLDHAGYLPRLFRAGYIGKVYCTPATKDLCQISLRDNAKIMANRLKHFDHVEDEVFYNDQDVTKALAHMVCHPYHEPFKVGDLEVEFFRAGHILGAASPVLRYQGKTVQFSGDLGRFEDLLMQAPDLASTEAETIVMEGTYGNRLHSQVSPTEAFKAIIEASTGTILMPAFSIGRSQSLMLFLLRFFENHPELEVPVYIDSPMTMAVTELYPLYAEEHKISAEDFKEIKAQFRFVEFQKQRDKLAKDRSKKIILTASGMLSGGYILSHLSTYAEDPSASLILAGYQAEGTLGRQIAEGTREIEINEEHKILNLNVYQLSQFSSHQDHNELLSWLSNAQVKKVYLAHGEEKALGYLAEDIQKSHAIPVELLALNKQYQLL